MSNIIQFSKNKDTNITSAINEKSKFNLYDRKTLAEVDLKPEDIKDLDDAFILRKKKILMGGL